MAHDRNLSMQTDFSHHRSKTINHTQKKVDIRIILGSFTVQVNIFSEL